MYTLRKFFSLVLKKDFCTATTSFSWVAFSIFCVFFPHFFFTLRVQELDERMRDLKTELQSFDGEEYDETHKRKAMDALKRMESWNLFSDEHEVFLWSHTQTFVFCCYLPCWFKNSFSKGIGFIMLQFYRRKFHIASLCRFAQEFQSYTVARDTFLAHLGATLWGSMRHIISPSVADGAFHHYEKISFQLVFITQEVCSCQMV